MRSFLGTIALLATFVFGLSAASAAADGFQLVGAWGASEKCHDGAYAFEASGHGLAKVVRYNGKTQSSPISVKVAGDIVQVTDEETLYTYRILGPNKLLFVGFTKLSNGLTADVKPYAWHRCG